MYKRQRFEDGGFKSYDAEMAFERHVDGLREDFDDLRDQIAYTKEQPAVDPHEDAEGCWEHETTLEGHYNRINKHRTRHERLR